MNFYFFINFNEIGLNSSLDVFNSPPINKLFKNKIEDKKIIIFTSNNDKWEYYDYGIIKKNTFMTINHNDLPNNFKSKSVFIYLSDLNSEFNLENLSDYTNSVPEWRCNIRIGNNETSCSYQGEYPGKMINKDLSLISCTPMIQSDKGIENYFILVNLNKDPKIKKFKVEILDSKKNIIDEVFFQTNTVNKYLLKDINTKLNNMIIFKSQEKGGIPIYFSRTLNNKSMSLEHTHPPQAYYIFGDTLKFQKFKKNYWFK